MGLYFRKKVKIFPGVSLNFSKNGLSSVSVGKRGASVNFGSKGTYVNAGIPGTGIYSRTKLAETQPTNSYSSNNSNNNNNGCCLGTLRYPVGLFFLLGLFCVPYTLNKAEIIQGKDDIETLVFLELFYGIMAVYCLWPWIKYLYKLRQEKKNRKAEPILTTEQQDTSGSSNENWANFFKDVKEIPTFYYGLDYAKSLIDQEFTEMIAEVDSKIEEAKFKLSCTIDKEKQKYLQSFISKNKINRIDYFFKEHIYNIEEESDTLDPLFFEVACKAIKDGYFSSQELDRLHKNLSYKRRSRIVKQLQECGVIHRISYDKEDLLVKTKGELKYIIYRCKGKSLLSVDDKKEINNYLEQKKLELLDDEELYYIGNEEKNELYINLSQASSQVAKSKMYWDITEGIEKRSRLEASFGMICFNHYLPFDNVEIPCIYFMFEKISYYLYPNYIIKVASYNFKDFELIPYSDFKISFQEQQVSESIEALIPNDAVVVSRTHKSGNAQIFDSAVAEYGVLHLESIGRSIMISNKVAAEAFSRAYNLFVRLN